MNSYPAWFRNLSDVKEFQKLDFFVRYNYIHISYMSDYKKNTVYIVKMHHS